MRNRTERALAAALALGAAAGAFAAFPARAPASAPSVADLDAVARASGNRLDVAEAIGRRIFSVTWPAQISQVSANAFDGHVIVGIRLWGVKFHHPITRAEFATEVQSLVAEAFAAAPSAEEVDLWASVPIEVGKDVVVSGDLAKPTTRTVFSVSVRRAESPAIVHAKIAGRTQAYWDEAWAERAFEKHMAGGL